MTHKATCLCGKEFPLNGKELRILSREDWEFAFDMACWKGDDKDLKSWKVSPSAVKTFIKAMLV